MNLRYLTSSDTWAALPDLPARGGQVDILNTTGEALFIRYTGETDTGEYITIADGGTVALPVNSNAKEIEIQGTVGAAGVQIIVTP